MPRISEETPPQELEKIGRELEELGFEKREPWKCSDGTYAMRIGGFGLSEDGTADAFLPAHWYVLNRKILFFRKKRVPALRQKLESLGLKWDGNAGA